MTGSNPARELAPSQPPDNETGGSLVETPDPASGADGRRQVEPDLPAVPEPDWDAAAEQYRRDQGEPSPASSRSIYEGTPKPHGLDCRCADCVPATSSEEVQSSSRAKLDAATAGASATSSEAPDPAKRQA